MKESYWGYFLIILGIFIVGVMLLINSTTTNSTQDYYTLKEVTQASMIDAVDFAYYRLYGTVKMSEQKFIESFLRRFADSTSLSNTYNVEFYDLYEVPPKVSVKVSTKSGTYNVANDQTSFDVTNTIDAILEWEDTSSNGNQNKKCKCPIDVTQKLVMAARNNQLGCGYDEAISNAASSCWSSNGDYDWRSCKPVVDVIESRLGDISSISWAQLSSNNSCISDWLNKGYISIREDAPSEGVCD